MARTKKIKVTITEEELNEIREENRTKLNAILSNPNWRYELGKKHFGEQRWQKVFFGERHPDYDDWRKDPNREKISDTHRPLSEWDTDGNLIDTYANIEEVLQKYDWEHKRGIHIIDSARNKNKSAYQRIWKFEDIEDYD